MVCYPVESPTWKKREERNRKGERNFRQTKAGRVNGDKENGVEGDKVRSGRKGEDDQV